MTAMVNRPNRSPGPSRGLLDHDHFQIAYATNDIERACDVLAARLGIRQFQTAKGHLNEGGEVRAELAWVGGMMYELIAARGPGSDFINERLAQNQFSIRHHHSAYFVYEEAIWQALEQQVQQSGRAVLQNRTMAGFLRVFFVEATELGHYLEYIFPGPAAIAFFESVPAS
jgi:hypothetical protein